MALFSILILILSLSACDENIEQDKNIDQNCEVLTYYADDDGDGYGDADRPVDSCYRDYGLAVDVGDCNDDDPNANPAGTEVCDAVDNNCDGVTDEGLPKVYYPDSDGDGYGSEAEATCEDRGEYVELGGDCDDARATVNPDADELCNEIDDNCDG